MKEIDFEKEITNMMKSMEFLTEPSTKLNSILHELKAFASSGSYSPEKFKQKVQFEFKSFDFKNFREVAQSNKEMLLSFCSTRQEALKTVEELMSMSQLVSSQIQFGTATSKVASEFMTNLEKSLFSK